jgi:hypothetical protein
MWSTRVGAEVMKPLAAPVLGGMVSSLLHVLVVTPVIFFWLRERRLGLQHEALPAAAAPAIGWARLLGVIGLTALAAGGALGAWRLWGSGSHEDGRAPAAGQTVRTLRADALEIVLLSATGQLKQGRNTFTIEFRSGGRLVDVGTVRASANMPMPGMVMPAGLRLARSGVPGRYVATAEFGMAGAWQMAIEWDGPAGRGSLNFEGAVQ